MEGQLVREYLHSGKRVYGTHLTSKGDGRATRFLFLTGLKLDFVFLCTEHHPWDRSELSMACQLYRARNMSPMVRIPFPSAAEAAMALDVGAEGIVAPYVETVEQVRELVGAVHYRPLKGKLLAEMLGGGQDTRRENAALLERIQPAQLFRDRG